MFGLSIEEVARNFLAKHGPSFVLGWIQRNLKLENLPKLRRIFLLTGDKKLVEESWKRIEAVVTKYGNQDYARSDFGTTLKFNEDDAKLTLLAIASATGIDTSSSFSYVWYNSIAITGGSTVAPLPFNFPNLVWHNGALTGDLKELIGDDSAFQAVFEQMRAAIGHLNQDDPLYFLASLSPVIVLYLLLTFLSDRLRVEKLHPLMDILISGQIPYCQMPDDPSQWIVVYRP